MRRMVFFAVFFFWVSRGFGEGERRVQIVNATSVSSISLEVDGREDYPDFPQGLYTGDAPVSGEVARFGIKAKKEGVAAERVVRYGGGGVQTVVLLGDFRDIVAEPIQNQRDEVKEKDGKNVFVKVYPGCRGGGESVRYRWVNGMGDRPLLLSGKRQEEVEIPPFGSHASEGQEACAIFSARAGEKELAVSMAQRGMPRNAIIVFYLKGGEPAFLRVFEPPCVCRDCGASPLQQEHE